MDNVEQSDPSPRRGGRPRAENPRSEKVTVRLLPQELDALRDAAEAAHERVAVLARKRVTQEGEKARSALDPKTAKTVDRLYSELGRIGSNVNQIARAMNSANLSGSELEVKELRAQLTEIRHALRGLLDWLDALS